MARSRINNTTNDLITDGGAILWSLIKGEQIEFPITLNFIEDASVKPSNNYAYEAVVIEAANTQGQTERPTLLQPAGQQTRLFVRLPVFVGTWNAASAYNKEEVVFYNNKYYKLLTGLARVNATVPSSDPMWVETTLNKIYVQFPNTLASNWAVNPIVNSPVYGFFELRVTEPSDPIFSRTFKPVRGMVEILFSPTDLVTDIPNQTTP